MPTPGNQQISLSDTPFYHCISRCVRRTFLCGIDSSTGNDYTHRKEWFIDRLALLAHTFAIDICAYSVMSNHFHGVFKINESRAQNWNEEEIIRRWNHLFTLPVLVERKNISIKTKNH